MKRKSKIKSKLVFLFLGAFILLSPLPSSYKKQISLFVENLFNGDKYSSNTTSTGCFKVSYMVDGDTIVILNENNEKEKIRLYGIDAFEITNNDRLRIQMKEYGLTADEVMKRGNEAKEYLEGRFGDNDNGGNLSDEDVSNCVYITRKGKDRYGRTLAKIYYGADDNRVSVQDDLLRKGLVKVY